MRPDLHFLYNLVETVPLALALACHIKRPPEGARRPLRPLPQRLKRAYPSGRRCSRPAGQATGQTPFAFLTAHPGQRALDIV
jgi:hypothetical protein